MTLLTPNLPLSALLLTCVPRYSVPPVPPVGTIALQARISSYRTRQMPITLQTLCLSATFSCILLAHVGEGSTYHPFRYRWPFSVALLGDRLSALFFFCFGKASVGTFLGRSLGL